MTYRIHYKLADGSEDTVVVSGDTIEEVREVARYEVWKRDGSDPWSEEL